MLHAREEARPDERAYDMRLQSARQPVVVPLRHPHMHADVRAPHMPVSPLSCPSAVARTSSHSTRRTSAAAHTTPASLQPMLS